MKKKSFFRLTALLLVLVCLCSISAFAAEESTQMLLITSADPDLYFSGGKAYCSIQADGSTSVTKVNAQLLLKEYSDNGACTVVGSWPATVYGSYIDREFSMPVTSGKKYTLAVTVAMFSANGNDSEYYEITKVAP